MALYPASLRPEATTDLVRIGNEFDGGYVLPARLYKKSKALLSFGLSDDWTFEAQFAAPGNLPVAVFDHTVTAKFWLRKTLANAVRGALKGDMKRLNKVGRALQYRRFFTGNKTHIKRPVGYAAGGGVSLSDAIAMAGFDTDIFLKVDIEGWEYRILDDIAAHAERFTGLAFEFHDIDLHGERIARFVDAVSPHLFVVHFHPNTYSQVGPDHMALHVEVTFMARRLLEAGEAVATRPLPIDGLDAVNIPGERTRPIAFAAAA